MDGIICTEEIAQKALAMGACEKPEVGLRVCDFSQSDLIWAERLRIETPFPVWTMSKIGSGFGDGNGYGYGYGEGNGYGGYGSGGYGSGGYGYGGYGDGNGYGE